MRRSANTASSLATRAGALALAGLLLGVAASALWSGLGAGDWLRLAARLEAGARLAPDQAERLEASPALAALQASCGERARAAVTLRLATLDAALATPDTDALDRRAAASRAAVTGALACDPHDANLWLRLAMLRVHAEGPVPQALDALALSRALGPAEGWLIPTRLAFAARLAEAGAEGADEVLARDWRVLVKRGRVPSETADLIGRLPEAARMGLAETRKPNEVALPRRSFAP